jgi:hypothetical protein
MTVPKRMPPTVLAKTILYRRLKFVDLVNGLVPPGFQSIAPDSGHFSWQNKLPDQRAQRLK